MVTFFYIACGEENNEDSQTESTSYEGNFSLAGTSYSKLTIVSNGTYTMRKGNNTRDEGTWQLATNRAAINKGIYIFTSKLYKGTFSVEITDTGVSLTRGSGTLEANGTGEVKESSSESSGNDENLPEVSFEDILAYNAMDDAVNPIALPASVGTNEFAGCTVESNDTLYKYVFTENEILYYECSSAGTNYELTKKYAYTYNTSDESSKYITYQLTAYCKGNNDYTSPKAWIDEADYQHVPIVLEYFKASFTKLHKQYYDFDEDRLVSTHGTTETIYYYPTADSEPQEGEVIRYYYYDDANIFASTQFMAKGRTLKYDGLCFASSYEDLDERGHQTQFYSLFVPKFADNSSSFTGTVYKGRYFGREGKTLVAAVPHAFDTLEKVGEVEGFITINETSHEGTLNFIKGVEYLHIGNETEYTLAWLEHEAFFEHSTVIKSSINEDFTDDKITDKEPSSDD